jgi:hypothetical protein
MSVQPTPDYSTIRSGQVVQAYNEAAFRYFLAVDRRRAKRCRRSLLLVLAAVQESPGRSATLTEVTSAALFSGLRECFREIDIVGWYRQGRIAAAVLVQGVKVSGETPHLIAKRVLSTLKKRLPPAQEQHLRVRIVLLGTRSETAFR